MKRRTFIKASLAMLAVPILARSQEPPRCTKHLYQNDEGETVAANSLEEASRYHDCYLGGKPEPDEDWTEIDDDEPFTICNIDGGGEDAKQTKLARDWASECHEPTVVASTYW